MNHHEEKVVVQQDVRKGELVLVDVILAVLCYG